MIRILTILGLIILTIGIATLSACQPHWISDDNSFLKEFIGQDLLSVLGIIVTITLASTANLHLQFNRLEDTFGEAFKEARNATKAYAYLLIGLFFLSLVLVVLKPVLAQDKHWEAAFNGSGIIIVALNILSLMDIIGAVFAIPPDTELRRAAPQAGTRSGTDEVQAQPETQGKWANGDVPVE